MRLRRARNHEQAGCVAVEPMHDPLAALLPSLRAELDEALGERSALVPTGRMDDEPGRLVDHEQVLVLEGDLQVDRLCVTVRGLLRQLDHDLVSRRDGVALRLRDPHRPAPRRT